MVSSEAVQFKEVSVCVAFLQKKTDGPVIDVFLTLAVRLRVFYKCYSYEDVYHNLYDT